MIKEFQIEDILNAVNSISKIEQNKTKVTKTKNSIDEGELTGSNKQAKSEKNAILVLNQVIK